MTTLQHLTEDHLQDEQTSSQPGSLALLIHLQENVSRLVTSVIFGAKSSVFWGKRNLGGSWEKTSQESLALNMDNSSGECLMTWPHWGIAQDGVCMELQVLELSIQDGEFSLLPTVTASEYKGSPRSRFKGSQDYRGAKMSEGLRVSRECPIYTNPRFATAAMGFPTSWLD
jgi:hypothetical protein